MRGASLFHNLQLEIVALRLGAYLIRDASSIGCITVKCHNSYLARDFDVVSRAFDVVAHGFLLVARESRKL